MNNRRVVVAKREGYPLYRVENLELLNRALREDEFDDDAKAAAGVGYGISEEYRAFVDRNVVDGPTLDVGCGSGLSFEVFPFITHGVDVNPKRLAAAQRKASERVSCTLAAAECLPYEEGSFSNILHIYGYFQVRSEYETLLEYNRALVVGGRFVFDLPSVSRKDVLVFGRIIEPRAYVRIMLADFGFELVERRTLYKEGPQGMGLVPWDEVVCVEKVREFDYKDLKKLQVVAKSDGSFIVNNYDAGNPRTR